MNTIYELKEIVELDGKVLMVVGVDENCAILDEYDVKTGKFSGYSMTVTKNSKE